MNRATGKMWRVQGYGKDSRYIVKKAASFLDVMKIAEKMKTEGGTNIVIVGPDGIPMMHCAALERAEEVAG